MGNVSYGERLLALVSQRYTVTPLDVGADERLSKSGMTFHTRSYEVEGLGHLCLFDMRAMLGLMRMETVFLSPTALDAPLMNLDWVGAFGRQTLIAEFYDTQLAPWPAAAQAELQDIAKRCADLPDAANGQAHWYDALLYPCSCHKAGRGIAERLDALAREYSEAFVGQLAAAPRCDVEAKRAKVRAFAESLVAHGGPAVDQITKLFGSETARRLILRHMYGV